MDNRAGEILKFWFGETQKSHSYWWQKNSNFDQKIERNFEPDIIETMAGKRDPCSETAHGRLALIITLDQFPRNIYRNTPDAFSCDEKARQLTLEGVELHQDKELSLFERTFFYLPLEHAEDRNLQARCVELFEVLHEDYKEQFPEETKNFLSFAKQHKVIIDQFGRFPHRNQILNRKSTKEEAAFLQKPNSSF